MEPKKFTAPGVAKAAARAFPKAAPGATSAIDRPAKPLRRAASGPAVGAGPVSSGVSAAATVEVRASAVVPKGSYAKARQPRKPEAPPLPPVAQGPVSSGAPAAAAVRVEVRAAPGEPRNPPNATRWRFPPPPPAPLPPVDAAAVKTLAAAAAAAVKHP